MRANMLMIKKRAKERFTGQMVASTKACGKMESKRGEEHTRRQVVRREWVNGLMVNALAGSETE
jgi:hypothetical protein